MNWKKFALGAAALGVAALAGYPMLKPQAPSPLETVSGSCAVDLTAQQAGCSVDSRDQIPIAQSAPTRGVEAGIAPTAADEAQLKVLNEVLASHNDNDPRLDRELRVISPAARQLLRARYLELAAEKRNERGTIVFLLGRNLENQKDFEFLSSVVNEAPCRSLRDCQAADAMDSRDSVGGEMGIDVTLNYPQIVAVKAVERLLAGAPSEEQRQLAIQVIRQAMSSPVRSVSGLATELYNRLGGKTS